jgi:FAD-dependent oxidoreductase domain-containing protein 1
VIGLVEPGYLYLAGAEGAAALARRRMVQQAHDAPVLALDAASLAARFPWMAVDDLALGTWGEGGEGWFDGPALWRAFERRARAAGARFVRAEVQCFETCGDRIGAAIDLAGQRHAADTFVLAAGAWSAPLAQTLGLTLPVSPRKRDVFFFDSPALLPGCPLVIDPSGVWFRPEGRGFIAGAPPRRVDEGGPGDPDEPPLEAIDFTLFEAHIWPNLARRVPAFEAVRLRSAWAGYYEMNHFDHNGLAGALPGWRNGFTACGFSGHGMQQAPAVGAALAALIAGGRSEAPAIEALSPRRLLEGRALREDNVI